MYLRYRTNLTRIFSTRKWSFWVLLFIFNVVISGILPFIMARLIDIGVNSVVRTFIPYRTDFYCEIYDSELSNNTKHILKSQSAPTCQRKTSHEHRT
jgi:hypothetical protein